MSYTQLLLRPRLVTNQRSCSDCRGWEPRGPSQHLLPPGLKVGKRWAGLGAPNPGSQTPKGAACEEARPTSRGSVVPTKKLPASWHWAVWAQLPRAVSGAYILLGLAVLSLHTLLSGTTIHWSAAPSTPPSQSRSGWRPGPPGHLLRHSGRRPGRRIRQVQNS